MDEDKDVTLKEQDDENANIEHTDTREQMIIDELVQVKEAVSYLQDLFVRRLNDDKQKNVLIQKLKEGVTFSYMEPFLHDLILLLDRLETTEDDFAVSVREELYDIINRRGVRKIEVGSEFNPALYKAVKVVSDSAADSLYVSETIRNGYTFSGKVIRPAEVAVVKPAVD